MALSKITKSPPRWVCELTVDSKVKAKVVEVSEMSASTLIEITTIMRGAQGVKGDKGDAGTGIESSTDLMALYILNKN